MSWVGSIALFEVGEVNVIAREVVVRRRAVDRDASSRIKEGIGAGGIEYWTGFMISERWLGRRSLPWCSVAVACHDRI